MKQVGIGVVGIVLVGALAVGFLLGRYVGQTQHRDGVASASATATGTGAGETASTGSGTAFDGGPDRDARPALTPATPANTATGSSGSVATTAHDMQAGGGPRPFLEDDLAKFADTEKLIRTDGGVTADMLELSEQEEQDDGARRLEQLIAQAIRIQGESYTQLRIAPPHCTRSVCVLRGVGVGNGTDPRANMQRLSTLIANEPWWREAFDDMSAMVGGSRGEMIYLAFYMRCEPGQCRFSDR